MHLIHIFGFFAFITPIDYQKAPLTNISMKVFTFSFNDNKGGAAISAYRLHTILKNAGIDIKMFVARKFTKDESVIGPKNVLDKLTQLLKQKICQLVIYIFFNNEKSFISPSLFQSDVSCLKPLPY